MISLSTPFSFETASTTIRISLFIDNSCNASRPQRRQPRAANLRKRHRYHGAVHIQFNTLVTKRREPPGVASPPLTRLTQFHQHPLAEEALKMRRRAQHPIQAGRGHLQRVTRGHRILDVEQRRDLTARTLAVVESDALRAIDKDAQQPARATRYVLQIDQLVAQLPEQRLGESNQLLAQRRYHRSVPGTRKRPAKNKSPMWGFQNQALGRSTCSFTVCWHTTNTVHRRARF